jgi:hypothetical protein
MASAPKKQTKLRLFQRNTLARFEKYLGKKYILLSRKNVLTGCVVALVGCYGGYQAVVKKTTASVLAEVQTQSYKDSLEQAEKEMAWIHTQEEQLRTASAISRLNSLGSSLEQLRSQLYEMTSIDLEVLKGNELSTVASGKNAADRSELFKTQKNNLKAMQQILDEMKNKLADYSKNP